MTRRAWLIVFMVELAIGVGCLFLPWPAPAVGVLLVCIYLVMLVLWAREKWTE